MNPVSLAGAWGLRTPSKVHVELQGQATGLVPEPSRVFETMEELECPGASAAH